MNCIGKYIDKCMGKCVGTSFSRSFVRFWACMVTLVLFLASTGCQRSGDDMWNDTKTAGRHVQRGAKSLGGKQSSSKQVRNKSQFDQENRAQGRTQPDDFIAFEEDQDKLMLSMEGTETILPPQETPGEIGSSIPGIEFFKDPSLDPELAMIFEHIHFDYNSSFIKGEENSRVVQKIIDYMKANPGVYVFVEGHCDKRGPSAYNFALGANRSNAVRNLLVGDEISQDRIFTISFGKERPLFDEDGEDFQSLNRRCQFKVYTKTS